VKAAFADRLALASQIRSARTRIAVAVTDEFLERHPDFIARFGDEARRRGEEDALFHVDFLAAAIEAGEPQAFADYAAWTAGVLKSRGIAPAFLAENLRQVGAEAAASTGQAELIEEFIAAGIEAAASERPAGAPRPLATERRLFRDACLSGGRAAAVGVAREVLAGGNSHLDLYADVIEGSQHEIGDLWASNEISVAQEHLATAVCQHVLAALYPELPVAAERRGRAVVTGVEGELHQLGAHVVADALEADGWAVRFLGTDLPRASALEEIARESPDLLAVSVTLLPNLDAGVKLIQAVHEQLGEAAPAVIVGGRAFAAAPGLAPELGAIPASGVRGAVEVARSLADSRAP
jgi:MerR family transcriptional regulator, light-induced transcriptional regulator